jgi:hypothetical protein
MSKIDRINDWNNFAKLMETHLSDYCNVQYGSPEGTEQIENFTVETCFQNILRYVNRRNSNTRGNKEKLRDLLKIAHYSQFIYDKLKKELGEENIY